MMHGVWALNRMHEWGVELNLRAYASRGNGWTMPFRIMNLSPPKTLRS